MARENIDQGREANRGGSGNFKEDPDRAREAGRSGGQRSQGGDR